FGNRGVSSASNSCKFTKFSELLPSSSSRQIECLRAPNRFTSHIRLPNLLYNISMSPRSAVSREERTFWNPKIFALPYWAKNQYIIVSMVTPDGESLRRNILCEVNICHPKSAALTDPVEKMIWVCLDQVGDCAV
ncbi:hypothetical protein LSUB1_G003365, partial [Lachnellula subtilissima]